MPAIYFFVYATGGIKYVYSHTMYIPIVLAGVVLGGPFGVLSALVGGVLLGPLMPLVVETGESQETLNWIFRLVMFVAIGGISGYFAVYLRKSMDLNRKLMSTNRETGIPNQNYLINLNDNTNLYTVITILVDNKIDISDVFGEEIFWQIMNITYHHLKAELSKDCILIQADTNKIWILYPHNQIENDANAIHKALKKNIIVDGISIYVEFYIGAQGTHSLNECKTLIPFRETDRFARYAKKNNLPYAIWDGKTVLKRLQIELLGQFANALKENQTFLTYHPIVKLETMKINGFEALIRWNHPIKGIIQPNDFIPLVESTQLIHPLLDWVVQKSLDKINEFKENHIKTLVSINLSGKNFRDPNLSQKVIQAIKKNGVDPSQLKVEITETVLMNNPLESQFTLRKFKEVGIAIAIDDFGTGYSSFSYLSKFMVDYLKIDRHFISKMDNPAILEIVKAMINLAHQLKMEVVAEGVETKEEVQKLIELGCDCAQGFYFCKPVHQDEIIEYYKNNLKYEIE